MVARRKARAQQRRYEHRLRTRVREHRGCLDAVSGTTRRLLGLRAGLEGRPLSRGEAASRLGISSRRAASLEHTGLRTLQVACGVSAAPASPRVARLAGSAPALQPASFLVPATSAPELKPAVALAKPRGSHAVEAATATSRPSGAGGGPVSVAAALESGSSGPGVALILALCLATLAVVLLVALRRSVAGRQQPQPAAAAAPAPAPPPEPAATYVPPQQPAEQEPPARPASRAARAATVAATTAVGVIVRELLRRRGGRR